MIGWKIGENGLLQELHGESGAFSLCDDVYLETDRGGVFLSELSCREEHGAYIWQGHDLEIRAVYEAVPETEFLARTLSVRFIRPAGLLKLGVKIGGVREKFLYNTFWNASAAVFGREDGLGFCCGFENPFCRLQEDMLTFVPGMVFSAGEEYVCEKNFYGIYPLSGVMVQPHLQRSEMRHGGRYHPRYRNPDEGIPLDREEIRRFCAYTDQYFGCAEKKFRFTVYDFFGNLPQRPETEEQVRAYMDHIDAFVSLGGDTIILNPLYPNRIPDENPDSFWELFPENTHAQRILDYAREKGLSVGMYTGTAGNGEYGNSPLISYADCAQWKKVDVNGRVSRENCLADDGFTDWFIRVQKNTIRKYGLNIWNWDPGPGHGFFCYSPEHGHLPGQGAYKGFRNALRVMRELKEAFPDLYIQGFHGNKEYGLWGFRDVDQHEAYWENEVYVMAPVFEDLSPDRNTANGIRFQSVWNRNFRFMSPALNHGLAHRMIQSCWMMETELDRVFDHIGWQYALLSAIAAGGSVTLPILPREPEKILGYAEFYRKWIGFARENFSLSRYTVPFGAQPGCGCDGFAKIRENRGYIFLFNPFPKNCGMDVPFAEELGFAETGQPLRLRMCYPLEGAEDAVEYGSVKRFVLPAYGCIVLEVNGCGSVPEAPAPVLPRTLARSENGFCFFGDLRIRELLHRAEAQVGEGTEELLQRFNRQYGRVNACWNRTDRLWLWVPCGEEDAPEYVLVNGKTCPLTREVYRHNELSVPGMAFGDITDLVRWDSENTVTLPGWNGTSLYLHYPACPREALPERGEPLFLPESAAPVLDRNITVEWAGLNGDNIMVPEKENTLSARISVPFEELEGVYASVPISIGDTGYDLKRDMVLEYVDGVWKKTFRSGKRLHLIVDDRKIVVWAVTKDGRETDGYPVEITWLLD